MQSTLWDDTATDSDSTDRATTTTVDAASSQSPLAAAIEASSWSRADIELALQCAQVTLLAIWLYSTYHD